MPEINLEGTIKTRLSESSEVKEAGNSTLTIDLPMIPLQDRSMGRGIASARDKQKVAYIVSRFPKLTETFITL
jgi:hypothetical protein